MLQRVCENVYLPTEPHYRWTSDHNLKLTVSIKPNQDWTPNHHFFIFEHNSLTGSLKQYLNMYTLKSHFVSFFNRCCCCCCCCCCYYCCCFFVVLCLLLLSLLLFLCVCGSVCLCPLQTYVPFTNHKPQKKKVAGVKFYTRVSK